MQHPVQGIIATMAAAVAIPWLSSRRILLAP
jgi:hypothetical protein